MTETLYMSGTAFRAASGKFDSSKRYLRAGNTLSNFPLCSGKTLDVNLFSFSGADYAVLRYSVDGYVQQTTHYLGAPISAGSYNAPFLRVTT